MAPDRDARARPPAASWSPRSPTTRQASRHRPSASQSTAWGHCLAGRRPGGPPAYSSAAHCPAARRYGWQGAAKRFQGTGAGWRWRGLSGLVKKTVGVLHTTRIAGRRSSQGLGGGLLGVLCGRGFQRGGRDIVGNRAGPPKPGVTRKAGRWAGLERGGMQRLSQPGRSTGRIGSGATAARAARRAAHSSPRATPRPSPQPNMRLMHTSEEGGWRWPRRNRWNWKARGCIGHRAAPAPPETCRGVGRFKQRFPAAAIVRAAPSGRPPPPPRPRRLAGGQCRPSSNSTGKAAAWLPAQRFMAAASELSFSGVPVPWALT